MAEAKTHVIQSIARNRRATYDFELSEKFEAGLVLVGTEVKTLRDGQADLSGSFVTFQHGEAWLRGVNIPEMQGTPYSHDGKRARKLLLNRREIEKMQRCVDRDGMTIVATEMYFKDGRVKIQIALARGKKNYDKRQSVKTKDADREARVAMSRGEEGLMDAISTPLLSWEGGKGQAAIARLDGELMDVHASTPSAPGSRPTLALPSGEVIRMKVHRCRNVAAGAPPGPDPALVYFLEGRLIDASRVVRAEIENILGLAPQTVAPQPETERTTLTGDAPDEK